MSAIQPRNRIKYISMWQNIAQLFRLNSIQDISLYSKLENFLKENTIALEREGIH
jgi:hypothetical protein